MKTIANVYLLPANKKSTSGDLVIDPIGLGIHHAKNTETSCHNTQHLYISLPQSDLEINKIKENDYIFLKTIGKYGQIGRYFYDKIFKTHDLTTLDNVHYPFSSLDYYEKIIATTDSLIIKETNIMSADSFDQILYANKKFVPSIPQSFIKHYISEYNKGNIIKQIEIELDSYFKSEPMYIAANNSAGEKIFKLKLNQNNEIFIMIPEENITKDIVREAMKIVSKDVRLPKIVRDKIIFEEKKYSRNDIVELVRSKFILVNKSYIEKQIDDWIKETLK